MTWIAGCWIIGGAAALFPLVLDYGNIDAGYQPFYGQNGVCLPLYIHEPYMDQGWIFSLITFVIMPFTASVITIGLYFAIFHHLRKSRPQAYRSHSESCYLRKVLVITISNNISWATIIVTKVLALSMVSIPGEVYAFMAIFILPVNCCLNPLIYTMMTPKFKSFWSFTRWCPSIEFSKSRAEAAALRRAVTYPAGVNGLNSRYGSYSVPLRRSNGSSTTLSSRYTITNFNGQSVTFSRQNSSQMQLTARIRKEPLQGRRSNPVTQRQAPLLAPPLSALLTTGPIMTDSNVKESSFSVPKLNDTQTADLDTDEDQGIVVLNTSNAEEPLTSSPKWDW
ncbi:hypothetical protein RvY_00247-2 [Ramazzottius varieornatus]|nr:hypothetical protein RvY_00247-2 [Ramazzottius varieornatus]